MEIQFLDNGQKVRMVNHQQPDFPNQPSKKFYFLEYFYVLLKSIEYSSKLDRAFDQFIELKQQHRLGDSRYKKLTPDVDVSSPVGIVKFQYTFQRVLSEAEEYDLVIVNDQIATLTSRGRQGMTIYEEEVLSCKDELSG
jgi:hypothetical protein